MENDILDSLEDLGYDGPLLDEKLLADALASGAKSVAYTQLVEWAVSLLASFYNIDSKVSAIQGPSDSEHFLMELSGFLREFACPYSVLTEGPIDKRLATKNACLQLLDYLLTELASAKILALKKPAMLATLSTGSNVVTEKSESDIAKHLKEALMALKFPKPPDNITSFDLFTKLENKLKGVMTQNPELAGKPLLKVRMSDQQWAQILEINAYLSEEYRLRREMLLKRLDNNENKIAEVYQPIRKMLIAKNDVTLAHILAARDDLTRLQKTSSGEARERTKCAINKILIGKVPDRGGRAWELEPPPPEMPAFTKRDAGSHGAARGGRDGGRDGGGGSRVQGSWGNTQGKDVGGNWNQGGGGYHQGGGYQQGGYQQQGGGYQRGGQGGYQQDNYSHRGGYQDNYQGGGGNHQGGYSQRGGQGGYQQDNYSHGGGYQDNYQGGGGYRGGGRGGGRGRH
ncbi:protein FAM98A [Biomphalaria pfeifferi]|uniref:Protein FAM98A n=1 Tax=Biomphalaria pfeifferi TaxID=112525 RepID=A0AAD8B3M5_BIOPF|nr:protein FAM98A [Biomphalaria pfeifferi]